MRRFATQLRSQRGYPATALRPVSAAVGDPARTYEESAWRGPPPPFRSMKAVIDKLLTHYEKQGVEPKLAPDRDDKPRAKFVVHPSSVGGCGRSVALSLLDTPKDPPPPYRKPSPPQLARISACGHTSHRRIQAYFFAALKEGIGSVSRVWENVKLKITGVLVVGECDAIVEIAGKYLYLVEIKTITKAQFVELKAAKKQWEWQTRLYMKALGLKGGIILVECRDNCEMKEFYVEWDDEKWEEIRDRINLILKKVRNKKLPLPDTVHCHFCDYKRACDAKGGNPKLVPWKNLTNIRFPDQDP